MPASGDQHKSAWTNPFEEEKTRVSQWTAQQIATLAARLDKQLGPEYISTRPGSGGSRFHYLSSDKCIGLANEIFGFNGWSSSIQNIQVDFADENPQTQRVSIGLSVIVRVTLQDGTFHEDVGYGSIENAKGKAMAFEKAKKEGTTDALKRALRNFGNVLGNCVYDKDYLAQVTKIKVQPVRRFDADGLHRHPHYLTGARKGPAGMKIEAGNGMSTTTAVAAVPQVQSPQLQPQPPQTAATAAAGAHVLEPLDSFDDFLGDFDEADFCVTGDGHPDEVLLTNMTIPPADAKSITAPAAGNRSSGAPRPPLQPQPEQHGMPPPPANPLETHVAFFSARSTLVDNNANSSSIDSNNNNNNNASNTGTSNTVNANSTQQPRHLFNPKAESPSIRKTPGIDHSTSKPLARNGQHVAPPPSSSNSNSHSNSNTNSNANNSTSSNTNTNTSTSYHTTPNPPRQSPHHTTPLDHTRRIGAPGSGMPSPLANRGQYKPPTMKRALAPPDREGPPSRSPLSDVGPASKSVNAGPGPGGPGGDGLEAKRQKVT